MVVSLDRPTSKYINKTITKALGKEEKLNSIQKKKRRKGWGHTMVGGLPCNCSESSL
jgi:hypothetical protein